MVPPIMPPKGACWQSRHRHLWRCPKNAKQRPGNGCLCGLSGYKATLLRDGGRPEPGRNSAFRHLKPRNPSFPRIGALHPGIRCPLSCFRVPFIPETGARGGISHCKILENLTLKILKGFITLKRLLTFPSKNCGFAAKPEPLGELYPFHVASFPEIPAKCSTSLEW